jgi:hypothetical protein
MGAHAFWKKHEMKAYGKPALAGKADFAAVREFKK